MPQNRSVTDRGRESFPSCRWLISTCAFCVETRRVSGTVLSVMAVGDLSSGDAWKVRETASATTQPDDASTGDEDEDEDDGDDDEGPPPAKRNK